MASPQPPSSYAASAAIPQADTTTMPAAMSPVMPPTMYYVQPTASQASSSSSSIPEPSSSPIMNPESFSESERSLLDEYLPSQLREDWTKILYFLIAVMFVAFLCFALSTEFLYVVVFPLVLVPGAVLLVVYWYARNRESVAAQELARMAVLGSLSTLPVLVFEQAVLLILAPYQVLMLSFRDTGLGRAIIIAFLTAGPVEEVSKYLLIRFFGLKRGVAPRSAYALVLYGMAAAVGFAAVETNMYMMVSTSWGELLLTALVRCLLPIHPLTGAIIAVGFVRRRYQNENLPFWRLIFIGSPAQIPYLIHSLFDFVLICGLPAEVALPLAMLILAAGYTSLHLFFFPKYVFPAPTQPV